MSEQKKSSDWYFPPDVAAVLGPILAILVFLYVSFGVSMAKRFGDTSLFHFALFLGGIGAVLLFLARLPLYRQRRFFTLGPRSLSGIHRKLYYAAYLFIVPSAALLLVLLVSMK